MAAALLTAAVLLVALNVVWFASGAGTRVEGGQPCAVRWYNYSSFVCVCNATYCDAPPSTPALSNGGIAHYTSSRCGQRLSLRLRSFKNPAELQSGVARLRVDTSQQFQRMLGFGGGMSDSTAINIRALSSATQQQLLRSYFGSSDGSSQYSLVRLPMGGTDFSVRNYTYDDSSKPDPSLKNFALQPEDIEYKIPLLLLAQRLSGNGLKIHAAPWSAPRWMKAHNGTIGISWLQSRYYQTWANYFVKFLKEYRRRGVDVWAVSLQNEPTSGAIVNYGVNSMGWSAQGLRRFLEGFLGPTLRRDSSVASTDIIIGEDTRAYLDWTRQILNGAAARRLTSGVAVHWYQDSTTGPAVLDDLHRNHRDLFILYTEACYGPFFGSGYPTVRLGSWERAENYTSDIIQVTNHWTSGWEDWNMVVNTEGGPNWSSNPADASIVANATADEFYKQPMYYAIAHFSRFVPRGSRRVSLQMDSDANSTDVEGVAFLTPQDDVVVVLQNKQETRRSVVVSDPQLGEASLSLPAHSMHTLVYRRASNTV
ncbi:lysosomal acid glucosylceramidase-like isoform X2 [Schistocerca serialis cubense]|uniref:lysosomal acid glucosylceramidase-like isoform X2 n=1 Tax=Schistocerca serialis cubense TaxID=2023355 RepID=UPI00214ED37E|nr:lysosomal acid glucosylceramidase-like isoform X2 [Schistocerca serialis cubense]